jgi:hypothetical protein
MTPLDYALNLLLVAAVVRQMRGKKLTPIGLLWPVGLVLAAAVEYLRSIPSAGNDLGLAVAGAVIGATLGCLCGLLTRIDRRPDDSLLARATGAAAVLWVLGVGARMAFALYAENGGGPTVARFSAVHHITSAAAWTAALILMALTEVLGRTAVLAGRALRVTASPGVGRPRPSGGTRR